MGVDLGSDRLRNHRLTRAGWPVKQDAFGRVNTKSAEQFRMFEWQLDHLSNLQELLADTTDVFVGDAFGLADVFLCNGFVLDDDLRVGRDHHDAFGHGLHDGKRKRFSEKRHPRDENSVASHHGTLGKASLGKAFYPRTELDLLLVGHDRGDGQFLALLGLDFSNRYPVAKTDAGVFPNDTVHSDDVHFGVFRPASPIDGGCRTFFATDFNEVAGFEVEAHFRGDARPAETDVGRDGFGYA